MHKVEIPDINFSVEFASDMNELTTKQFLYLVYLITQVDDKKINIDELKNLMVLYLLGVKHTGYFTKLPENKIEDIGENVNRIKNLIDYIFEKKEVEGQEKLTINLNFIKNHIPSIRAGKRLFGPSDALQNITFIEFIDAHKHFIDYIQTRDVSCLNRLIAVLYRRKRHFHFILKRLPGYNGHIRIKYNENTVDRRSYRIAKLPFYKRYAIFLIFSACNDFLKNGELQINGNPIKLSILYEKDPEDSQSDDDGLGLAGILYKLAETNVFGNIGETAEQNLYDILLKLYQQRREYISYKSNLKKND